MSHLSSMFCSYQGYLFLLISLLIILYSLPIKHNKVLISINTRQTYPLSSHYKTIIIFLNRPPYAIKLQTSFSCLIQQSSSFQTITSYRQSPPHSSSSRGSFQRSASLSARRQCCQGRNSLQTNWQPVLIVRFSCHGDVKGT